MSSTFVGHLENSTLQIMLLWQSQILYYLRINAQFTYFERSLKDTVSLKSFGWAKQCIFMMCIPKDLAEAVKLLTFCRFSCVFVCQWILLYAFVKCKKMDYRLKMCRDIKQSPFFMFSLILHWTIFLHLKKGKVTCPEVGPPHSSDLIAAVYSMSESELYCEKYCCCLTD